MGEGYAANPGGGLPVVGGGGTGGSLMTHSAGHSKYSTKSKTFLNLT